jgi:N utilization substance protein A
MENPLSQITIEAAQIDEPDIQVGDFVEDQIDSVDFGRIAAQTAKQVIVQKVREAERARVIEAFQGREGELLMGTVKRVERGSVYLDLGDNVEAFIPREEMIPREAVRPGDRIRGYLKEVRAEARGPQLFVSRTAPEFLVELFKLEVPEVDQGLIDIIGGARDPGSRAKVSVRSLDPRLDPVGACVGMRGSRVQSVSNELAGERVDIILWNENPAQFVVNAMSPAEVTSIVVDEDAHSMNIAVEEDKLAMAIGRGGQNVRLASELTGWELNVMTEKEAEDRSEEENHQLVETFKIQLDVDAELAEILVAEGFSTIEEVAYVPESELEAIEEFDNDIVSELRNRARDYLLTQAIMQEEILEEHKPAEDLLSMEGMDQETAMHMAALGICTMEDLAEQSVDELMVIDDMDEERASSLIMKAREPWFAAENQ